MDSARKPEEAQAQPKSARHALNRRSAMKRVVGVAASLVASSAVANELPPKTQGVGQVVGRRQTGPSSYKSLAAGDYQRSLQAFGGRLAAAPEGLRQHRANGKPYQFDVLVIGSGYGASVIAARLAPRMLPGCRLAVLERGREWVPGTHPDRLPDVTGESRLALRGQDKGTLAKPDGLFNVQQFEEVTVLTGSGLGGCSLINASVAIRPDREVFNQTLWPTALRDRTQLDPYYELAEYELGVATEPFDHTKKMIAQRFASISLAKYGARWEPAGLMVNRRGSCSLPVLNRQGVWQRPCTDCGDCLTGCNVGAKNTLALNYLPIARRAGAEMYTQVEVHWIEKCVVGYRVHYTQYINGCDGQLQPIRGIATARMVILGAGSIGSSEILMRSRNNGLGMSARLGQNWTGNGDALGFIRKSGMPTNIGGYSAYDTDRERVGPTIQTNLMYPHRPWHTRVLIQEGAAARAYANALGALMLDLDLSNTQILLGMGHDGAGGRIELDPQGFAQVKWPGILESEYRQRIRSEFQRVADAVGGEYRFLRVFGDRMISVHPMGGCAMADEPGCGVTNHCGEVFDGTCGGDVDHRTGKARVHEGLYVVDGSVFPTSIACNPSLTITAIAERSADLMLQDPRYGDLFRAEADA